MLLIGAGDDRAVAQLRSEPHAQRGPGSCWGDGAVGAELGGEAASERTWTYSLPHTPTSGLVGTGRLGVDLKSNPFLGGDEGMGHQ